MDPTYSYEFLAGVEIRQGCMNIVEAAKRRGETLTADFNGLTITATPDSDPVVLADDWRRRCDQRHAEYLRSPEHAEQQRKATEAADRRADQLASALQGAPAEPDLDREKWDPWLAKQTDGYSRAVFTYAHLWARLMEAAVARGGNVREVEGPCSHLADVEGITGAQHGMAKSILRQCWRLGSALVDA